MKTVNLAIMFTDIVGFTERTARQSREENEKLIEAHDSLLLPIVAAYSGTHVKSIGDALLCVFPSPTNAVLCAMSMQDALFDFNLKSQEQDEIHIRIGINLGEVRLSKGDVFGDAVNLASRIQSQCPPDEIYFSDAVYLAMNKAEVPSEDLGAYELKGAANPVRIWTVPRFSSAKLVADQSEQNKDIADIAFPFGGAHLRVPAQAGSFAALLKSWRRPLSAAALIILTFVVFYPAGSYLQSKTITPFKKKYATAQSRVSALETVVAQTESRLAKDRQKLADTKADRTLEYKARRAITKDLDILIAEHQEMLEMLRSEILTKPQYLKLAEEAGNITPQTIEKQVWKTSLGLEEFEKLADIIRAIYALRIKFERTEEKLIRAGSYKAKTSSIYGLANSMQSDAKNKLRKKDFLASKELYEQAVGFVDEALERETKIQKFLTQDGADKDSLLKLASSAKSPEESLIAYGALLRLEPSSTEAIKEFSEACIQSGRVDEAIYFLKHSGRRYEPFHAAIRLGRLLANRGEFEQAASVFESARRNAKNPRQAKRAEELKQRAVARQSSQ